MAKLSGRVALVTGSSRGIGAAIAKRFAIEGARVAVHGRDRAALDRIRSEVVVAGGQAVAVAGDLTRFSEVEDIRQQVESVLGPIDTLVANAGASVTRPGPLEEITEEGWQASVAANLTATFFTIKSILPGM